MMLDCSVRRKQADEVEALILEVDPGAYITSEEVTPRRSGVFRQ
jgi:uncharacterized protein YebE (UPF0316 family)